MRRKTMFIVLMILMTGSSFVQAQDGGGNGGFNYVNELSQRASTPQSPEAVAFGRYGDVAVNMYAGTPNIQVPMYTHKGREFDLSIGLTYDASGIKVNQLPTPVGLGWNFDVGGRISRVVNGLPDDFISANSVGPYTSWYTTFLKNDMIEYAKNEYRFGENYGGSHTYKGLTAEQDARDYIEFLEKIHQQEYETQPDMYMVNAPGLSEAFVFDLETKTPYALYNPNIIIQVVSGNLTTAYNGGVTTFKVITDNGTQYFFDAVEQTERLKDNDTYSHYLNGSRVRFNSSWYLTKIISSLGKDEYEFEYALYTDYRDNAITNVMTEKNTIITGPPEDNTSQYSRANTSTRFFNRQIVSKIIHNDKVIVEVDTQSQYGGGPDVAVTGITTYANGTLTSGLNRMKRFDLEYSYFKTDINVPINTSQELNLRLKLDHIVIKDADLQEVSDYMFDYIDPFLLPSLSSSGQDYLGYYNGAFNSSLIPGSSINSQAGDNANRGVNFISAKKGLLEKITYPTGGHTVFEYEQAELRYPDENIETEYIEKVSINHAPSSLPSVDLNQCNKEVTNISTGQDYVFTPNVFLQNFEVTVEGTHYLEYTKSGNANFPFPSVGKTEAILIKKPDPLITYTWADILGSNCEYLIDTSYIVWEDRDLDTGNHNDSFSLNTGHYQLLIPIYDTGYSKTLIIDGPIPVSNSNYIEESKAGIRVKTIKDYKDTNTLVKQKEYTYNHTAQISNPIFEYITNEKRFPDTDLGDPSPAPEDYQLLHVVAQPINGDIEHIVNRSVTESIVDLNNTSNTISKTYSFNSPDPSQGVYGKGNYQLVAPGTGGYFSSSHYSKLPSFGSVKGENTTISQLSSQLGSPILHYQTFGLAVAPIGRNSVMYPTIQAANEGFHIIMMGPKFIDNNEGGAPTPTQPDECMGDENCRPELARLMLHKTKIYGYHGGDVNQTTVTTDGVTSITANTYTAGNRRFLRKTETTNSNGSISSVEYSYPFQLTGYNALTSANMISTPVRVISKPKGITATTVQTEYSSNLLPTKITTKKGGEITEDRMAFELYDNEKNLLQARQTNGTPISFIWGYNNRYVVAKIVNIEYANIPIALINQIKSDADNGTEASLLGSLQNLQDHSNLSEAQMSYYTYKPNIGVTTMTDVTGYRMRYLYDNFQRLVRVEDQDGYILSENEYNYKN